jgi:UDP-3-O-[3-hydroxymyristoyl] glucosamine N-acyltransferase
MIAGSTNIGKYCLLGIRSTVIDKLEICDNVVVGAGSLVTKNITAPGNYVGSPARKVLSC